MRSIKLGAATVLLSLSFCVQPRGWRYLISDSLLCSCFSQLGSRIPALPFCRVRLTSLKPMTCRFPGWRDQLSTLGDHLRQRRLLNCQTMKQAGRQMGVTASTIWNWENRNAEPALRFLPGIIKFLGYDPMTKPETLADKLIKYRQPRGWTQKEMARRLGVDPGTLARWERLAPLRRLRGRRRWRAALLPDCQPHSRMRLRFNLNLFIGTTWKGRPHIRSAIRICTQPLRGRRFAC